LLRRPIQSTHRFDQLPIIQQRSLVLDIATPQPRLDLIPHPLQLLDLSLKIILKLVLLRRIRRMTQLFERLFEYLDALGHGFEGFVDFG